MIINQLLDQMQCRRYRYFNSNFRPEPNPESTDQPIGRGPNCWEHKLNNLKESKYWQTKVLHAFKVFIF